MSEYQLTAYNSVIRVADGAFVPNDMANRDWVEYQEWLDAGGVPDPVPEPVPPAPSMEQTLALDHENRIRALEGEPPLTMADLLDKMIPK